MVPAACSRRKASRTGIRLIPSSVASFSWRSQVPTGNCPVLIRSRMAATTDPTRSASAPSGRAGLVGAIINPLSLGKNWILF